MNSMNTAPKDGTEILAYHVEGKNFHPIIWKEWKWKTDYMPCWGVRWNEEYRGHDADYTGWIEYPKLNTTGGES